jgi:Nif-specific regulatory protein
VRQLRNALERLVLQCDQPTPKAPVITPLDLENLMLSTRDITMTEATQNSSTSHQSTKLFSTPPVASLHDFLNAISKADGNKSRAAQSLGLTLRQLNYRLEKLNFKSQNDQNKRSN